MDHPKHNSLFDLGLPDLSFGVVDPFFGMYLSFKKPSRNLSSLVKNGKPVHFHA